MVRRIAKFLHLWLSVPAGIVIFLSCITGAMLVFEDELIRLAYPQRFYVTTVPGDRAPIDLGDLFLMTNEKLAVEGAEITSVQVFSDIDRTYRFSVKNSKQVHVYVDQYTGEIKGRSEARSAFFTKLTELHRWLMLKGKYIKTGKTCIGISTLLFIVILISGIVIWMPSKKRQWKPALTVKASAGNHRLMYDLHRVLGAYTFLLLLFMALTGLMSSFTWYRTTVAKIFNAYEPPKTQTTKDTARNTQELPVQTSDKKTKATSASDYSAYQHHLDQLKTVEPDYASIQLYRGQATVVRKGAWMPQAADKYVFNKNAEQTVTRYHDQKRSMKLMPAVHALHTGTFGALIVKILYFLTAIVGASLPVTGYWLWWKRLAKSSRRKKAITNKESSGEKMM